MQACDLPSHALLKGKISSLPFFNSSLYLRSRNGGNSRSLQFRDISRYSSLQSTIRTQASNINIGSGGYEGGKESDRKDFVHSSNGENSAQPEKPLTRLPVRVSVAGVLVGCALAFSLAAFMVGSPSALLAAIAKSGFTAAFTLIFVSEIGDKTFFIAALLAMQYGKGLVLMGSMGALSLMTILSVVIGRIFQSVPAQFRTKMVQDNCLMIISSQ